VSERPRQRLYRLDFCASDATQSGPHRAAFRHGSMTDTDLTIIIPVFNVAGHLDNLNDTIRSISGLKIQVIYVDDGSTDGSDEEIRKLALKFPDVLALFQPLNLGAGQARNLGWDHAQGRYTLFFDADDRLHGDVIAAMIARMDAEPDLDVTVLAYRSERQDIGHSTGMLVKDAQTFEALLKGAQEACGTPEDFARLLVITNYPWNKIMRTARYRQTGLRFGHTRVNNDILGHWHALLYPRRILLSRAEICTHVVHPGGSNLTNQQGTLRLQMFDALEELYDLLLSEPDLRQQYAHFFWSFVLTLFKWARDKIVPGARNCYNRRMADLITRIDLEDFARMRNGRAPAVATELSNILLNR
jgi:glycosyltransferase involved in cell wall biosynthesis